MSSKKILIIFFLLIFSNAEAKNWFPFPFERTYFGKRGFLRDTVQSGLNKCPGYYIDALILDASWTNAQGKFRGKANPTNYYEMETDSFTFPRTPFRNTFIQTNSDSSLVKLFNKGHLEQQTPTGSPFYKFFPRNRGLGDIAFEDNSLQFKVFEIKIDTVFGILDSVIVLTENLTNPFYKIKWSKNYGLLNLPDYDPNSEKEMKWFGAEGLSIGFNDFNTNGTKFYPKVGDEMHFEFQHDYTTNCIGYSPFYISKAIQKKVVAYPYQNDSTKVLYDMIESIIGQSTGIQYGKIETYYHEINYKIGYFNGLTLNLGWLGDDGIPLKMEASPILIDLGVEKRIVACLFNEPLESSATGFYNTFSMCWGSNLKSKIPRYIKSTSQCNAGKPFPPVTITSVIPSENKAKVSFYPNPVLDEMTIETGGQIGEAAITDLSGKEIKKFTLQAQDNRISLSGLPKGLYWMKVRTISGWITEKLIKE